jgi:ADP-ribose pyrophosphatase YjhB (NUDIX family)
MKKGTDFTGVCVIYFCHDGNGNYLMNKRSVNCRDEHGNWDCGGGGLEFGEKVDEALKKEIKEEYNAEVIDYEFLGFRDVHREINGIKSHWIALDFKVLIKKDGIKNGEPHKFDEIGWFKLNNLPSPLHSQLEFTIRKYENKLFE